MGSKLQPVILAGGSGSRLWPFSRAEHPKQFLRVQAGGTMLQHTANRLKTLTSNPPITICNESHRFFVADQLQEVGLLGEVILEPTGRNTAPAATLAALLSPDPNTILIVLAADHILEDLEAFTQAVTKAVSLAEKGKLVTFGVEPSEPHTGYGYIERGEPIDSGFIVKSFKEKPNELAAADYFSKRQKYFWNSGMFVFRCDRFLDEIGMFEPDILEACKNTLEDSKRDLDFLRLDKELFKTCPSNSIDYAVMERTSDAVVIPLESGWSDIGSWSSLWKISERDDKDNVVLGDVTLLDAKRNYVRSEDKLIACVGIENLVVVSVKDAVLVSSMDRVEDIKEITQRLKSAGRSESEIPREVSRPWGTFDSLGRGRGYQVKKISLKVGAKISVQLHNHRAEHWVVVSGLARVRRGEDTFILSENESTYIPIGTVHSLENIGDVPLDVVEIQSGDYLGEDDIVRLEDLYGRAGQDLV